MRWVAAWVFNNALHRAHGRSGEVVVEAETRESAVARVRDEASRQLFGGSVSMQQYVEIQSLIPKRD